MLRMYDGWGVSVIRTALILILLGCQGGNCMAVSFDHVVALGDSLFDDTAGTRSPVAAEQIARILGVPLTNLAQSGATSTLLLSQGQHTSAAAQFGQGDLALLWIGGNDFFGNAFSIALGSYGFLNTLQTNVTTAVSTLRGAGMDVVMFNLLDMSKVPAVLNAGIGAANFRSASEQWRTRLQSVATSQGAHVVDVFRLFDELVADPNDFSILGRVPILGPAYDCDLCVFEDTIHPSSVAQGFVANDALSTMNQIFDPSGTMPLDLLSHVELARLMGLLPGDFDENGSYGLSDIDALVGEIAAASDDPAFDLSGDGAVDVSDLEAWRMVAGEANLPSQQPYLVGDANLDGGVDGSDFNLWNAAKFSTTPRWSAGDFNADGVVDGSDFNLWNANKFLAADHLTGLVPEPSLLFPAAAALIVLTRLRPGRKTEQCNRSQGTL